MPIDSGQRTVREEEVVVGREWDILGLGGVAKGSVHTVSKSGADFELGTGQRSRTQ